MLPDWRRRWVVLSRNIAQAEVEISCRGSIGSLEDHETQASAASTAPDSGPRKMSGRIVANESIAYHIYAIRLEPASAIAAQLKSTIHDCFFFEGITLVKIAGVFS
jgi:hypothetical protein